MYENLLAVAQIAKKKATLQKEIVEKLMVEFSITHIRDVKATALSGGETRRVEIARSLLHNPKLLLLDEPTVGLDIGSRQLILKHVKKLCREKKLAVLWATHLIDEIDKGERVVIIHNGKILRSGEVGEIVKDTRTKNIRDAFNKLVKIKL